MSATPPLLEARGLTLRFPSARGRAMARPALKDVSLSIGRGKILGIVGESGSGKTTLGRCLLGLIRPSEGQVLFEGRDVTALSEREMRPLRRRMQMIFQDPMSCLNPRHTIRRILVQPVLLHELAPDAATAERGIGGVLERVGLDAALLDRYPHELSGGQRQRVGIARALAGGASLMLLDEPFGALDRAVRDELRTELRRIHDALGMTTVFVTHDHEEAAQLADRAVLLDAGRIVGEERYGKGAA